MRRRRSIPSAYLPAVTGYYTDVAGNMLSFPFNSSTPILYYNKQLFRAAGLNPDVPPKTWPEVGVAAAALRASGAACGFTTHWPSWVNVENFSALHNCRSRRAANGLGGLDALLTINNPLEVRHIGKLAEWQKTKLFDYSGRDTKAEPRFQRGECGIFLGSSATRADILAKASSGRLRHDAVLARRSRRAAEHDHRRRHAVGAARPAGRRIQRRRAFLRLPVAAGRAGLVAPENRLSSDHARRLRTDAARKASTIAIPAPRFRSSRSPTSRRPTIREASGSARSC